MWVAELHCAHGHPFEGWFGSRADYEAQQARGLVTCPTCGSGEIGKRLSAPRLNLGAAEPQSPRAPSHEPASTGESPAVQPAALLRELVAHLKAHTEDVGPRFAAEARRIHAEEAPARAIRGQASADERRALRDDGIEVWTLPDLDRLGGTH